MRSTIVFFLFLPVLLWCQQSDVDTLVLSRSATVLFDFGKFDLRSDADSTLQVIAADASKGKNAFIRITAHTDAIGSSESNIELSKKRADMVRDRLIVLGVKSEKVEIKDLGETKPVADNDSDEGRQQNRRATVEIYRRVKMAVIEGYIRDSITNKGIEAQVILQANNWKDSLVTDTSGYFKSLALPGSVVSVDVFAEGYFFDSQMLKIIPGKFTPLKFKLRPAVPGEKVDLKNFYFYGNQAVLLPRSEPELSKLLRFMLLNRTMKVEIAGHINLPNTLPVKTDTWHYELSVRRARLVYDYLIQHGVSEERLIYKGYGNWEMRFPKATSSRDQELNRRVEIRILETGAKISKVGEDGY